MLEMGVALALFCSLNAMHLYDTASVNQCYFYTLQHKGLTPRFLYLASSKEHGIANIFNVGCDPMSVYFYLQQAGDAFGWRLFGKVVTMESIHEVARSAFIGLMLIILPIFFMSGSGDD